MINHFLLQSLTGIHHEDESSLPDEISINEGSIDLNEQPSSETSSTVSFEKLLNDELGLHIFTEFLKKEFSQENIQFWIECEKLKSFTDPNEVRHSIVFPFGFFHFSTQQ